MKPWATATLLGLIVMLFASPLAAEDDGYVNFTFEEADIRSFIKLAGEAMGRRIIVDRDVEGTVTVVTPRIPRADVQNLFMAVLESVGCTLVREGPVDRVVRLPRVTPPLGTITGPDIDLPGKGLATRVFHIKSVAVSDVRKMLEALLGIAGAPPALGIIETTNHLIVTDTVGALKSIEKLIAEIDRPGILVRTDVVELRYVGADDMALQINTISAGAESAAERLRKRLPSVGVFRDEHAHKLLALPVRHSNSLILMGPDEDVAAMLDLIARVDVPPPADGGRLHVIFLKYLGAEEIAENLNALLGRAAERRRDIDGGAVSGLYEAIHIEASESNNALLVEAGPREFEMVRDMVDRLDQAPEQVLIEVVIAELSMNEELDWGFEVASLQQPKRVGDTTIQGASRLGDGVDSVMAAVQDGLFPRGMTVGVAHGTRLDANGNLVASFPAVLNFNALRRDGSIRILSSVPLLSQNNQEASVSVVDNIPILTSTIAGGTGTARDIIKNIERIDVGINLLLTPHVNRDGDVRMVLNPSIEAIIDQGPEDQFAPTIARREVSTTVTVPDGNTIVISGLIREDNASADRRVPVLGSIPLLGYLFRGSVTRQERTNLMIFVTPHVIGRRKTAEAMTEEWSERTGLRYDSGRPDAPDIQALPEED